MTFIGASELIARGLTGAPPISPSILGDDSPLTRGALRRLACDATIDLIVRGDGQLTGRTGSDRTGADLTQPSSIGGFDPLYVGRSARTVTQQQFTALAMRDRTCVVKGCNKRPAGCAAHHVEHWADGAKTDLDNLVLLCHQHHHDHHDRGQDLPHHYGRRWLTKTGWAQAPP